MLYVSPALALKLAFMGEFKERLKAALDHAKLGSEADARRQLGEALGVSAAAISQVLTGSTRAMTAENTAKAARFLGVSIYWLATGEGPMLEELSPDALKIARQLDRITDERWRKYAVAMCTLAAFTGPGEEETPEAHEAEAPAAPPTGAPQKAR
jgi:transcriptional regulator with XRE-family HTH domain